jgi:hypothetical protein
MEAKENPIKVVEMDVSLVRAFSFLCCPRCGQQVLTETGVKPCPHMWYMHYSGGGFEYVAPELEEKLGRKASDLSHSLGVEDIRPHVAELCDDIDAVIEFQLHRSGVSGCGPYSATETVCFDLLKDQER